MRRLIPLLFLFAFVTSQPLVMGQGQVRTQDIINGAVTNQKIRDLDASKLTGTVAPGRLTPYLQNEDPTLYGALANGSTDDRPSIYAALNAAAASGGIVFFNPKVGSGSYRVSSDLHFPPNVGVVMGPGAKFKPDTNVVIDGGAGISASPYGQIFEHANYGEGKVHLYSPVYYTEWWGAKRDGIALSGLSMIATSPTLTFPSGLLTQASVNQQISVEGARGDGGGFGYGNFLVANILSVNDTAHTATLSLAAAVSVSGVTGQVGTDDGRAFQAAGEALNAQGGGRLQCNKGIYVLFQVGTSYTDTSTDSYYLSHSNGPDTTDPYAWHNATYLTDLNGAVIDGGGATLAIDPANEFAPPHPFGNIFSLYHCKNTVVTGFTVTGPRATVLNGDVSNPHRLVEMREGGVCGVQFVYIIGASVNVSMPDNEVSGATGLWAFSQYPYDPEGSPQNIHVGNLFVHDGLYGAKFNDVHGIVIDNLRTNNIHRSLYMHGVHDLKAKVRSRNSASQDILFAAYHGRSDQDIQLDYHFDASDRVLTNGQILFTFTDDIDDPDPANGGKGTFRNIKISGEITCSDNPTVKKTGDNGVNGSSYYWTCGEPVEFIASNASTGANDTTGKDRRIENVVFENFVVNGTPHSLYETEQTKPLYVQSFYRNVDFRGGGVGAAASVSVSGGSVATTNINYVGDYYAAAPTVTATGGGCSEEPQFTTTISSTSGRLSGLTLDPSHPGVECSSPPILTFSKEADPWDSNVTMNGLTFRNCVFKNTLNMRLFGRPAKDAITFENVSMSGVPEIMDAFIDTTAGYRLNVLGGSFPNRDLSYQGVPGLLGMSFTGDLYLPATTYGKRITNTAASAPRTFVLPPAVVGKDPISFERTANFLLTVKPFGSDAILNGPLSLPVTGDRVTLRCVVAGTWESSLSTGRLDFASTWNSTLATGSFNTYIQTYYDGGTFVGGLIGANVGGVRQWGVTTSGASYSIYQGANPVVTVPNGTSAFNVNNGSTFSVGGGTSFSKLFLLTPTLTPTSVAANTTVEQTVNSVVGISANDVIMVSGPAPTPGTALVGWRVIGAGVIGLTFANTTSGMLTPAAGTYTLFVVRS